MGYNIRFLPEGGYEPRESGSDGSKNEKKKTNKFRYGPNNLGKELEELSFVKNYNLAAVRFHDCNCSVSP